MEFQEDLQGTKKKLKKNHMLKHMKFHATILNPCKLDMPLAGLNPSSIKILFSTGSNTLFIQQMVENIRVGFRQLSQTLILFLEQSFLQSEQCK